MNSKIIAHYDSPHQFEPLLPSAARLGPLLEKAGDLSRAAVALGSSTRVRVELRKLLRSMNSYYTNKLEGEHTRPIDIEYALQARYSTNADLARRQHLAIAHIETEAYCEAAIDQRAQAGENLLPALYSLQSMQWLHRKLFDGLDEKTRQLDSKTTLVPGELRTRQVAVGIHEAPLAAALPAFLGRWGQVYGQARRGELAIVAAAAAHHRLAWIHPFLDGNGRVARLHTHLLLHAMGLTQGLWSPLRGFARTEQSYRSLLRAADEHRRGNYDGRGNLTEQGLVNWIDYTLGVCLDQVAFMARQLDIGDMRGRIEVALLHDARRPDSGIRAEALVPLHYLFAAEVEMPRRDFKKMTSLGDRLATDLLSSLLRSGYLRTAGAYGPVSFAIPRHALRHYFPNLWPEAEADPGMLEAARATALPASSPKDA